LIQLITDTLAALVGAQTVVVVGVARYQMGEKKEEERVRRIRRRGNPGENSATSRTVPSS
jgi:hypothetical protein